MTLNKIIKTAVVSAVAAGSLLPLSVTANAGDWNRQGYGYGHGPRVEYVQPRRDYGHRNYGHRDYGYNEDYGYRRHRDHTGRNVAIGVFATILGLAIASEASRAHGHHAYSDYND